MYLCVCVFIVLKKNVKDFPGSPVVKNLPASGGGMGSIPGPGRFHMWWGHLSPCTTTAEPMCLKPVLCQQEKLLQ